MEANNLPINLASYVDATLLRPEATEEEVVELCLKAKAFTTAAVCVNPCRLPLAAEILKDSPVLPCTVVGFPLGSVCTDLKIQEIDWALNHGAKEIDMVMNVGWFKDQNYIKVAEEVRLAANLVKAAGAKLKVIVETSLLDKEELRKACIVVREGGADFIKTSTGFGSRGVSLEDVVLIRQTVGDALKIKASGGIRTRDFALRLIKAGADRLGTSSITQILMEQEEP